MGLKVFQGGTFVVGALVLDYDTAVTAAALSQIDVGATTLKEKTT